MKEIGLSKTGKKYKGLYKAIVDDEDFERVSQRSWSVHKDGNKTYAKGKVDGKNIKLHRFLVDFKENVDHKDGDWLNNCRSNLRPVTQAQNNMNQRPQKGRSSVFKGVYYFKRDKNWRARVMINRKYVHIGNFKVESEAAEAYNKKAKELFGEYAYLNEIT